MGRLLVGGDGLVQVGGGVGHAGSVESRSPDEAAEADAALRFRRVAGSHRVAHVRARVRHGKDLLGVLLAESRGGFGVHLALGHRGERILRLHVPAQGVQGLPDAAEDERVGRAR